MATKKQSKTRSRRLSNQKRRPKAKSSYKSLSVQQSLDVADIRDNLVILKDGSFRAVVEVSSINFDLMNDSEREAIELSYQSFLNSLYFPIQISVLSRQIEAQNYLKRVSSSLVQQNNMLLADLIKKYLNFLDNLVENSDIMHKYFYVIIPFYDQSFDFTKSPVEKSFLNRLLNFKNQPKTLILDPKIIKKAGKELRSRSQTVIEGLKTCSLNCRVLDNKKLIELYHDFYNPDAPITEHFQNFEDINSLYVKKSKPKQ